jgi:competence protein ComEC
MLSISFTPYRVLLSICVVYLLIIGVINAIYRDNWIQVEERNIRLNGTVTEVIDQRGLRQTIRLKSEHFPKRIQATIGGVPQLHVGDIVRVECEVSGVQSVNVEAFRYDRYLMKENVSALCYGWEAPAVIGKKHGSRAWLMRQRVEMEKSLQRYLHEPHSSLLIGLLYGAQSTMPDKWQEAFRRSGTMHIVAVSGYNVMLVSSVFMGVLTWTFLRRQHAYLVVLFGIGVFTVLAGGDAAVVRAAIMGSLVLSAQHIGRPSSALILLLIAATVMTMFRPRLLLDDAGFHLSFAAAAGLIWLAPLYLPYLSFLPAAIRRTTAETAAAITTTAPIMIFNFHQWSLAALFSNVIVVPLVPIAMGAGGVAIIGGLIANAVSQDWIGIALTMPAYFVLESILVIVNLFAHLPFFAWLS